MNLLTPTNLPPPAVFGFDPVKFPSWREGQSVAISRVLNSDKRFQLECIPPGSGKSLFAMSVARLERARVVILTRRKGLQDQLFKDFGVTTRIADVRGQSAYICRFNPMTMVDTGPCHAGMVCRYRNSGCTYYDALAYAKEPAVEVIVTNYAFWFTAAKRGTPFGKVDRIICDEAHGVLNDLSNFLSVEIHRAEIEALGITWPGVFGENQELWRNWADNTIPSIEEEYENLKDGDSSITPEQVRQRRRVEYLIERMKDLAQSKKNWVIDLSPRLGTIKASPVWPADYAEKYLFQNVPKILMMSGTIQPKTMNLLGIQNKDFDFHESHSTFPLSQRPFYMVEAPRMKYDLDEGQRGIWLDKIDQILSLRTDRRVIIHTGSYERRNYLLTHSRYRNYMIGHGREDIEEVIARFKLTPAPVILVSQSVTEGFDFPYEAAETQIIVKFPFPDTRDALTKARSKDDKDYGAYIAMQQIVQSSGRGMRAPDDWCETIIVDGMAKWAMRQYSNYAPAWFNDSVQYSAAVPAPLPKIQRTGAG